MMMFNDIHDNVMFNFFSLYLFFIFTLKYNLNITAMLIYTSYFHLFY